MKEHLKTININEVFYLKLSKNKLRKLKPSFQLNHLIPNNFFTTTLIISVSISAEIGQIKNKMIEKKNEQCYYENIWILKKINLTRFSALLL